jgi:hypothetical protein
MSTIAQLKAQAGALLAFCRSLKKTAKKEKGGELVRLLVSTNKERKMCVPLSFSLPT